MNSEANKKLEKFFSKYKLVIFRQGQIIIKPSDVISEIYFLKKGRVRMYSVSSDGEEITLHFFSPQTYFPIMLPLGNKPNNYYFEASEEVKAYKAPTNETLEFIKNDSLVLLDLTTRFASAINGLTLRIESLVSNSSYKQVMNLLMYFSKKFGSPINMTHEEIANWLSLERETVSRQIEKMQKEGLLESKHKKITIIDLQKFNL